MKSNKLHTYLFWAILGGFVSYMVFKSPDIDVDIEAYNTRINILQQRIDSIEQVNSALVIEADSLEGRLGDYDEKIKKLNSRIYVIQKETQAKLDSVDKFGDDELEQFFADRYRQYKDSVN